jgi:hypothetical protein
MIKMEFEYKDGKCIVLKKEIKNCLVLPKGTFSPNADTCLSREGFELLKTHISKDKVKSGMCCINRQEYEDCYIIPMGVLNPKISMLISHTAISGIGTAMAKSPAKPKTEKKKPVAVKSEPVPPPKVDKELDEATLNREIAEENLVEAQKALSDAIDSGNTEKAQSEFDAAQKALNDASAKEEEIRRTKRVKPDEE